MALTQLGNKTAIPTSPDKAVIEKIEFDGPPIIVRFQIPEFTSCCPITGAPDFARLVVDYVPSLYLCESKSLKLFITSWRSVGAFHEEITTTIGNRLWDELNPVWLRVCAFFNARGGIPIDIFYQKGHCPDDLFVPDVDLVVFKGR